MLQGVEQITPWGGGKASRGWSFHFPLLSFRLCRNMQASLSEPLNNNSVLLRDGHLVLIVVFSHIFVVLFVISDFIRNFAIEINEVKSI